MGSHNWMTREEAADFGRLLASIDQQAKKAMEPAISGKRQPQDLMPLFRRVVKHYLMDKDLARVKPTVRKKLQAWATKYGIDHRGNEPLTVRRFVNLTEDGWARVLEAVGGDEKKAAAFLRDAVMEKVAELESAA